MKKSILFLVMCFFVGLNSLQAAYLTDVPQTIIQPNGDTLYCFASGDEYYHWLHDANGFTIIQDPTTGYFVYAKENNGSLVPTQYIAGKSNPEVDGLKPYARLGAEQIKARYDAMMQYVPKQQPKASADINKGTMNNLVVFIRFLNDNTPCEQGADRVNKMFNDSINNNVSMYNYFKNVSYNQLHITSSFYPAFAVDSLQPGNDTAYIHSYQDIYPRSYYQVYNAFSNPNGYSNDEERSAREFALLKRASEYIADMVPSDLDIDYNDDGNVDNVCFVIRGNVEGWSDLLWPHRWSLYGEEAYIHGKRVWDFNFQLGNATGYFNVSTLCHEMFHSLGAPDLYHYYHYTNLKATGSWDLMEQNQTPPQNMGAYMKYKYGHWIDEIPELTEYGVYSLKPVSNSSTNNCYKIASIVEGQYYVLEYRNKSTKFDTSIPGTGLLIYHIDTDFNGNADFNGTTSFDEVYLLRHNGAPLVNGDVSSAYFTAGGRTECNSSTNPYPFLTDGTIDYHFAISEVGEAGDSISFRFGPANGCGSPLALESQDNDGSIVLSWTGFDQAMSYNIYRDNQLIATDITSTMFIDNTAVNGIHQYYATSVCELGESAHSNEITALSSRYWSNTHIFDTTWYNAESQEFTLYDGADLAGFMVLANQQTTNFAGKTINLANNIDMNDFMWEPIGTEEQPFEGLFNGNGFVISNLNYDALPNDKGFFGFVGTNGQIKNLGIENAKLRVKNSGGTLATLNQGLIANCYTGNNVMILQNGNNIGGLIGTNEGKVLNCYSANDFNTQKDTWIGYSNGSHEMDLGMNGMKCAIRIPAQALNDYTGAALNRIALFDEIRATYNIEICYGNDSQPLETIYEQQFKTQANHTWQMIDLNYPLYLDNTRDLWICIGSTDVQSNYLPASQSIENADGRWAYIENASWFDIKDFGWDYSWMMKAYVTTTPGEEYKEITELANVGSVIGNNKGQAQYLYNIADLQSVGFNEGTIADTICFSGNDALCTNVEIGSNSFTSLKQALNAWIDVFNEGFAYHYWDHNDNLNYSYPIQTEYYFNPDEQPEDSFIVYSNNGLIVIEVPQHDTQVQVFDVLGRLMYSGNTSKGTVTLPTILNTGVYVVRLVNQQNILKQKVIVKSVER